MALIDPEKKRENTTTNPRGRLGLDESGSSRSSTNRVGKMVEGTPLGMPKSPAENEKTNETEDLGTKPKVKFKKKENKLGSY